MTKITLEMVDEVINRTGASYKEAKDALEFCDGDILDAVVYIETQREQGRDFKKDFTEKTNAMIDKAKELIKRGNVARCLVEKDGKVVIDIPVNAGGLAALVFTAPTLIAVTAALAVGCQLKIVKDNGEVININDIMNEQFTHVKEKVDGFKDKVKGEGDSCGCGCGCDETCDTEEEVVEAQFMDVEDDEMVHEDVKTQEESKEE